MITINKNDINDDLLNKIKNYRFPLYRPRNKDYIEFLEEQLNFYLDMMKGGILKKEILDLMELECKDILSICNLRINGNICSAYRELDNMMKYVKPYLVNANYTSRQEYLWYMHFYRIRKSDNKAQHFNEKEMFHIPEKLKDKSCKSRFATDGNPCLYVSAAPEPSVVAWYECNCPTNFNIIEFDVNKDIFKNKKVLDFSTNYLRDSKNYFSKGNETHLVNLLLTLPLRIACSIVAKEKQLSMIPEYVFSQMLITWVKEDIDYLGIAYTSCDYNSGMDNFNCINYVFPVKYFDSDGYDATLKSIFGIGKGSSVILSEDLDYEFENQFKEMFLHIEESFEALHKKRQISRFYIDAESVMRSIQGNLILINSVMDGKINYFEFIKTFKDAVKYLKNSLEDFKNLRGLPDGDFAKKSYCQLSDVCKAKEEHEEFKEEFENINAFFDEVEEFGKIVRKDVFEKFEREKLCHN